MNQTRDLFFNDDHSTVVVGQDVVLSPQVSRKQNGFQSQLSEDTGVDSSADDAMLAYGMTDTNHACMYSGFEILTLEPLKPCQSCLRIVCLVTIALAHIMAL